MSNNYKNDKIDFVITWVDGNDPEWQAEKQKYAALEKNYETQEFKNWVDSDIRYRDWGILKYWFRAVEKYAPWVNKIYFVTWGHIPSWLNTNNDKLIVVNHKDFIPKKYLPTFNSNAIELNIHRIKGLSEQFVYFNDDMFLNAPVKTTDFFKKGLPKETAGFDCARTSYEIMNSDINNAKILNHLFKKRRSIKKYWWKWFNPRNGKFIIKTLCLTPWEKVTGISELHVASSYLKESFNEVWAKENERLTLTCLSKFRKPDNVNHWVVKGLQLLSGNFCVRSARFGKAYRSSDIKKITRDIIEQKHKVICINDYAYSEEEYIQQQRKIQKTFMEKYPKKSIYEK